MTKQAAVRVVRWLTLGVHMIIVVVLVAMVTPTVGTITAQLRSGYVPRDYGGLFTLVVLSFGCAAAIAIGLIRWVRGTRWILVGADVAVFLGSWSVFLVFVFSNDLPIVLVPLSPVALILAWRAPLLSPTLDLA